MEETQSDGKTRNSKACRQRGLKQAETAFIGEVKLLDGLVLLSVRAISNSALLIIYTQVGVRYDLWSEFGSSALLLGAIVAEPSQ